MEELKQLEPLVLYQGATSIVNINLSTFDFQGGKVVLTIKQAKKKEVLFEREFTTADIHTVTIPDEFTSTLKVSDGRYEYDLMWHLGDERFTQCLPSSVIVNATVGGYVDGISSES